VLLIVALVLVVLLVVIVKSAFVRSVEGVFVADVPRADVPVVVDITVEGVSVAEDITVKDVPADGKNINVIDVDIEEELKTLCQILSSRKSLREEGPEIKRRSLRGKLLKTKTYTSYPSTVIIIEEETEEELLARKFDEQLYGRRAAKRKSNYEDLNPAGRRPRDNKKKGDFRIDRRLKASRQKAVVESRVG
jgi:hypothetical protein